MSEVYLVFITKGTKEKKAQHQHVNPMEGDENLESKHKRKVVIQDGTIRTSKREYKNRAVCKVAQLVLDATNVAGCIWQNAKQHNPLPYYRISRIPPWLWWRLDVGYSGGSRTKILTSRGGKTGRTRRTGPPNLSKRASRRAKILNPPSPHRQIGG
ncbi:hypothetical protein PIB30_017202 [Stylosanthes scabra]|uniref:Uncharacterized protein n=1 Tax=Stylosanthes scabra TaxID=79078 RepID=A0ABU6Y4U4_9FABA|nr:hypothetical protein [Stylosanthes scabra]